MVRAGCDGSGTRKGAGCDGRLRMKWGWAENSKIKMGKNDILDEGGGGERGRRKAGRAKVSPPPPGFLPADEVSYIRAKT